MSVVFYDCRNMNRDINYYHTPFESFMSELFKNVFKVEKTLLVSMLLSKNVPDIFIIFSDTSGVTEILQTFLESS